MHLDKFLQETPLDMARFDSGNVVKVARQVLDTIKEARRRQILQNFIEHADAECAGRYKELIATCSRQRQSYAYYSTGAESPTAGLPQSYSELETHYHSMIEANAYLLHFDIEKLVVDEDELMVEGVVHQLLQGHLVTAIHGFEVDDPFAVYMITRKNLVIFIFDDEGKSCGEHAYVDGPTTEKHLSSVPADLVPEAFWNNPMTGPVAKS